MIFKINTRRTNFQKGFMLTEVLITALLIVIAMVGVLPILFSGVKSSKVSKTKSMLTNIAQKEVEYFNQMKYDGFWVFAKRYLNNDAEFTKLKNALRSIDIQESFCIDINNGSISKFDSTPCKFKKILISKQYRNILGDSTLSDDSISFSVTIRIEGQANETLRPVSLTSIITRDKLK
ncbi:MAG: hypothetical protein U0354_08320 [Candidatus Sericytochromatia bacterium]